MDAVWGITLSILVLYLCGRSGDNKPKPDELQRNTVKARWDRKRIKHEKLKQEAATARKEEEAIRRKQADELITVILPTINNDKK